METRTELVNVAKVGPSRWQPRQAFDASALYELALSIQDQGLINPVLVFAVNGGYELIAGERRTRAVMASHLAQLFTQHDLAEWCGRLADVGLAGVGTEERAALAGEELATIRATVYPGDDRAALHLLAVTENLDREGLTPIEEALAYKGLIDAYSWSQRDLAARVNKSQGYVAQRLALLELNQSAIEALSTRVISVTEARAIAAAPAALQDHITAYTVAARQSDDVNFSTRELEKLAHGVAEFIKPSCWQPKQNRIYKPFERNRLRIVRHLLAAGKYDAEHIFKLRKYTGYRDMLSESPTYIIEQWPWLHAVCVAFGAPELASEETLLLEAGMSCQTCIKKYAAWPEIEPQLKPCGQFVKPGCQVCTDYIGADDPMVMPLRDYGMTMIAREMGWVKSGNGVEYLDRLERFYDVGMRLKQQEDQAKAEKPAAQVGKIKAYYEWQATLPQEWRDDIQAHACEKCLYYTPLYHPQGLPPCAFALNPWEPGRAPRFAALVAQSGQIAPRCEGFRYREFDINTIAGDGQFQIGAPERVLGWVRAVAGNGGMSEGFWGTLYYIARNNPPQEDWRWSRLRDWLVSHWDALAGGRAAHILDVVILERAMTIYSAGKPVELLDLNGETPRQWVSAIFPFDNYIKYSYMTHHWPKNWPMPWKTAVTPE